MYCAVLELLYCTQASIEHLTLTQKSLWLTHTASLTFHGIHDVQLSRIYTVSQHKCWEVCLLGSCSLHCNNTTV